MNDEVNTLAYNGLRKRIGLPEVKEILKEIECYKNEELCLILLSQKENKALLDYITNLQQANKVLEENWNDLEEWIKNDKEKAMVNFECGRCFNMFDILDKMKEIKEGNNES